MLTHEDAQERARLIIKRMQGGVLTPSEQEFIRAIERMQDEQDARLLSAVSRRKTEIYNQMADLMRLREIINDSGLVVSANAAPPQSPE